MWFIFVWTLVLFASRCTSTVAESVLSSPPTTISRQPSTGESVSAVDVAEARSFQKSMTLATHLAEDLEMALQAYSSSSDVYSSSWADLLFSPSEEADLQMQMVLEDIERIVLKQEEEHRRTFSQEYDELTSSTYATMLVRRRLRRVLEQIQAKMVAVLRLETKAHFDDTMQLLVRQTLAAAKEGVITDGKDLRRLLAEARRSDLARLRALTRVLHQRLQSLLNRSIGARSLLGPASSRTTTQPRGSLALYDSNHDHLEQVLKDAENEMLLVLQLSDGVNPYLRTWPFPPLHINVNYLVDPRAYALSREFDPLYDEHKEGAFVPARAEPIAMPGVPVTPFDPNERARPLSSSAAVPPWQKFRSAVQDFFSDDEEDEEDAPSLQRSKEPSNQSRGLRWPFPRPPTSERTAPTLSSAPSRKASPSEARTAAASAHESVSSKKNSEASAARRDAAASSTASAPKFGRYSERIRQARAAAQQQGAPTTSDNSSASSRS